MLKLILISSAVVVFVLYHVETGRPATPLVSRHWLYTDTVPSKAAKKAATPVQNYEKGKNLIATSDCLACHRETDKLLGPAYIDVAKKYKPTKENIAMLANKVIAGGKGNWGEIPMTPHVGLPASDAKEMISYILSLKSK